VTQALALLRRLEAIDDQGVTSLGRELGRLPVHPRLARLLLEGQRHGATERAALAAALLSERDPFTRALDQPRRNERRPATLSDVQDRVEALEAFEHSGRTDTRLGTLHHAGARFVLRARDQLVKLLSPRSSEERGEPADALLRALLAAFPDRLARRREPGSRRGVMVGGRGVRLGQESDVLESELFLCIDVDAGQSETVVRQASAVRRDWLPGDKLTVNHDISFDEATERVTARRRLCFEDLTLEESQATLPNEEHVARILGEAAALHLERVLPAAETAAALYLTRVRCLRDWLPELQLPAFDDAELQQLLPWLCPGCRSFADLRKANWLQALEGRLTHAQRQAVEREAPERLMVPSGSRLALDYEVGRPPVLAVRIQEIFGLRETPRLAAGRVRVLFHLLAPNGRPQQVTDDLASFWANTYPQVRKDLRARYPKHAWPEDPLAAPPERRPQRKR
jgi:ATP-dependent helicase HrpB